MSVLVDASEHTLEVWCNNNEINKSKRTCKKPTGSTTVFKAATRDKAYAKAAKAGWKFLFRMAFCPACVKAAKAKGGDRG